MKYNSRHLQSLNQDPTKFITCLKSCDSLLNQLSGIKESLVTQYGMVLNGQDQILRSALNEAEALAWQTPYPHLFFPVLAEEKAISARRWAARQEMVRQERWPIAFAA